MALVAAIAFFVVVFDQLSKHLILTFLPAQESFVLIPQVLSFSLVRNTGIAFGLFHNVPWLIPVVLLAGMGMLLCMIPLLKTATRFSRIAYGLLVGGAIGNIIDRIRYGVVIDFIDVHVWPVFNVADSCISIAAFLLIVSLLGRKA